MGNGTIAAGQASLTEGEGGYADAGLLVGQNFLRYIQPTTTRRTNYMASDEGRKNSTVG